MTRIEQVVTTVFLAGFVLLLLLAVFVGRYGAPNVVSCLDNRTAGMGDTPAGHTPAMSVEVTSNRNGHIVERDLFGCTFYSYEPPPGQ